MPHVSGNVVKSTKGDLLSSFNLTKAVLTSTHNLCSGWTLRKSYIPLYMELLLFEIGVLRGILFMDVFLMATDEPF